MLPIYVTFYTAGTPYEREAAELLVTLRQMGLEKRAEISALPTLGDWTRNCAQKASFIRNAMLRHEGQRIVWLDADARVRKYPHLFEELPAEIDVAFHLLDGRELLSGTLYFGPGPGAWRLVQAWCERCRRQPDVWDQKSLQQVIEENPGTWNISDLPERYCCIFDRGRVPPESVVIEHLQRSRKHKRAVSS